MVSLYLLEFAWISSLLVNFVLLVSVLVSNLVLIIGNEKLHQEIPKVLYITRLFCKCGSSILIRQIINVELGWTKFVS